jgi:hypothetical protein
MKAQALFSNLKNLFGTLAVVLSMWTAMISGFSIGNSIVILMYADGYEPATYTIENLVYVHGSRASGRRTHDQYFAEGTVAGQKEKFGLGSYIQGTPQNIEDIKTQVHIGQKLEVLYNPKVPQNTKLRVLSPEKDFKATWKRRQQKMIRTAYGPWGIAVFLCLLFGILGRQTKSAIKFCIGASVFIVFAWIPTLIQIFFSG